MSSIIHRWTSVVDVTNEYPTLPLLERMHYLNIQCWDGCPPSVSQLSDAVEFIDRHLANGRLLVHCGHGKGRSATVVIAYLVLKGHVASMEEALRLCKSARPQLSVNRRMKERIQEFLDNCSRESNCKVKTK